MNNLFLRSVAILLHAVANFLLVTWLIGFDITGKWLYFIGFLALILVLLYLFIQHIISFIYFIKSKTQ